MNDYMFFVWVIIAIVQVVLFSFYLGKLSKHDQKIIEESIDIIPICNYNGYNYWLEETGLYRLQENNNKIDKKSAEKIDQMNTKDLSPVEVIYIVETIREQK